MSRRLFHVPSRSAMTGPLDPASAVYRTMLAELYFDLKFLRRAKAELDRALALDPNNPSAHSLLRKLESTGQTP